MPYGTHHIEAWSFRDTKAAPDHFEVVGGEHMERLLASRRDSIVLGAHFGMWEVGLSPYEERLSPMAVIAKRAANPLMRASGGCLAHPKGLYRSEERGR